MKKYVVWFLDGRGMEGHENLYPNLHIVEAVSLAEAVNMVKNGFIILSRNDIPRFIFPGALLSVKAYRPK